MSDAYTEPQQDHGPQVEAPEPVYNDELRPPPGEGRKMVHASDEDRDVALMGILGCLAQFIENLAEHHPSLGITRAQAAQIRGHYNTLTPQPEPEEASA